MFTIFCHYINQETYGTSKQTKEQWNYCSYLDIFISFGFLKVRFSISFSFWKRQFQSLDHQQIGYWVVWHMWPSNLGLRLKCFNDFLAQTHGSRSQKSAKNTIFGLFGLWWVLFNSSMIKFD